MNLSSLRLSARLLLLMALAAVAVSGARARGTGVDPHAERLHASPTIEGMLDMARDRLDIFAPAGDFLYRNAFELFMQVTASGFVVDKAMISGVKCDHLAFSGPEVDSIEPHSRAATWCM